MNAYVELINILVHWLESGAKRPSPPLLKKIAVLGIGEKECRGELMTVYNVVVNRYLKRHTQKKHSIRHLTTEEFLSVDTETLSLLSKLHLEGFLTPMELDYALFGSWNEDEEGSRIWDILRVVKPELYEYYTRVKPNKEGCVH